MEKVDEVWIKALTHIQRDGFMLFEVLEGAYAGTERLRMAHSNIRAFHQPTDFDSARSFFCDADSVDKFTDACVKVIETGESADVLVHGGEDRRDGWNRISIAKIDDLIALVITDVDIILNQYNDWRHNA